VGKSVQKIKVSTYRFCLGDKWLSLSEQKQLKVFRSDKKCIANIFAFGNPLENLKETPKFP
jgi:hypothetical protein